MLKFKTIDKLIKENNLKGEMHKNVVKFIDNMDKSNIGKHGNENLKALSGIKKNYEKNNKCDHEYDNDRNGPNINLKYFKKNYDTDEEKMHIIKKIKIKKKTELCKNWEIYHDCFFKDECSFAHGIEELKLDSNLSGSKNRLCTSFQEKGYCLFGKRCNYRHVIKEKRYFTYQYLLKNNCNQMINEINKKQGNETLLKIYKKILYKNKVIM